MAKYLQIGYTLFEIFIALAISSILLLLAIPSFHTLLQHETSQTKVQEFVNLLNYAKLSAIKLHAAVSVCASIDHSQCNSSWQGNLIVFVDKDMNGKIPNKTEILRIWQLPPKQGIIYWQGSKTYLTMRPTGINSGNAGKFYYCPNDHDVNYARAIIINLTGRIRVADKQEEPMLRCQ